MSNGSTPEQSSSIPANENHSALMDQIYSWQTGIYDLTRRYFLFGRNELLDIMRCSADDRVLELGCGTGRNLRMLAQRNPDLTLYGLDCSQVMLDTARAKFEADGIAKRVGLANALGEAFHYQDSFALDRPFTKIFFSYSLTMIPTWRETLENALRNLTEDGEIWIVDFYDQREMWGPARGVLVWWLSLFHVSHKQELLPFLEELAEKNGDEFTMSSHLWGYYYIARYKRKNG